METLQPTYRILMGIPGKSNAFAISKKLGLDEDIIEDARARMDEQDESLEDLLTELETSRVSIEREKSEIEKYRRELAELKEEARTASEKMERERQRVLAEARQEADSILSDAKSYADETIRSFRKFGKAGIDESHMERERERLRKKIKDGRSKLGENLTPTERGNHTADEFHLGDRVHVISMNADGTVLALPDERGLIQVQMGILKSKVPITDVKILADDGISGPGISKNRAGRKAFAKSLGIQTEINLLGKTVDEAVGELEKYLDNAYLAHLTEVRIVHGKGTGALRKGVQQYLKRNKHVKSFRLGGLGEGDTGVTIAELKS